MMLMRVILHDQEVNDNHYEYLGVPAVATKGFMEKFGEDSSKLSSASIKLLLEKYPERNWDYLQVFEYEGESFWIISDALQGEHLQDEHITFLLPEEY